MTMELSPQDQDPLGPTIPRRQWRDFWDLALYPRQAPSSLWLDGLTWLGEEVRHRVERGRAAEGQALYGNHPCPQPNYAPLFHSPASSAASPAQCWPGQVCWARFWYGGIGWLLTLQRGSQSCQPLLGGREFGRTEAQLSFHPLGGLSSQSC